MTVLPRAETGIPGLDFVAAGGLPRERVTLVSGTAGSGKTVFGLQFLAAGARELDEPGVMVTFIEPPEELIANTESFGWSVGELVESGRIRILDAVPSGEAFVAGTFDFSALSARIAHAVEELGAKRLVIDPLDALLSEFGEEPAVRRELNVVIRDLKPLGLTTVITSERTSEADGVARRGFEEFLTDNAIVLRNTLQLEVRRRTVEVLKFRGTSHQKGEYPFVIDPQTGIEVVPVSVIEEEPKAAEERILLGDPKLDEMCSGGVYRDSLVLVSGATGTGKTLMGLQFLRAGLEAGERSILLSFEESAAQIVRNGRSWGWDLEAPVREGKLKIVSRYPERMGLEDLLVRIKRDIEGFEAERVAIDGVSALETNAPPKGFREFAVGLASYLKGRGVGTMLTTTREGLTDGGGATEAHLSTITDAIVVLRYVDLEGELHRGILVAKLRGASHSRAIHEYEIGDDGMHVLEPFEDVGGILAGAPTFVRPATGRRESSG